MQGGDRARRVLKDQEAVRLVFLHHLRRRDHAHAPQPVRVFAHHPRHLGADMRAHGLAAAGLGEEAQNGGIAAIHRDAFGEFAYHGWLVEGLRRAIHRVARGAEGDFFLQPGLGRLWHGGHGKAQRIGGIGDQHASAAAHREHAQRVVHRVDALGGGIGDVQRLLGGAGAQHAEFAQHRLGHRVIAGDGGGVGFRRLATQGGAADLHHHDGFAVAAREVEGGEEFLAFANALGIGANHIHLWRAGHPAQHIAQRDIGLIAGGDANRRAKEAVARHGIDMGAIGARLRGDADPPGERPAGLEA